LTVFRRLRDTCRIASIGRCVPGGLDGERALASIERVSDDLQEKVDQFEEREDALRERFRDAMA